MKAKKKTNNLGQKIYMILCIVLLFALALSDALIILQHNENTKLKNDLSEKEKTLKKRDELMVSIIHYRADKIGYKPNCMYFSKADLPAAMNIVAVRDNEILSKIYSAYDSGRYDIASFLCEY